MSPADAKKPLGRGLSALLGEAAASEAASTPAGNRAARLIPVAAIRPNEYQPRRVFTKDEMDELVSSVRAHGVLQPILVRRDKRDANRYELIAGERRWRAAQAAPIHEIPAVVRDLGDREALALALVENLQREDLTPVDEARSLARLMRDFGQTQEVVAEAIGKSRSHVANLVRLLSLPDPVLELINGEKITAAHGRLLIGRADAELLAAEWARTQLTVRDAEESLGMGAARAKPLKGAAGGRRGAQARGSVLRDANTADLERRLANSLGVKVRILHRKGKQSGMLQLAYESLDQLDDIIERIGGAK